VTAWRRSWYAIPPLLEDDDPRRIREIEMYQHYCGGAENVPRGESLDIVAKSRIKPFLDEIIHPTLMDASIERGFVHAYDSQSPVNGGTGLVVAHANSLRALIGVLCKVEEDDKKLKRLESMKISTGVPLVIRYTQLEDGTYLACDFDSSNDLNQKGGITSYNDLPVYPLSSIPKYSVRNETRLRNETGPRKVIRLDVI
jgi:bisphosphoglycerate-dependent phosphoglycerate mutase